MHTLTHLLDLHASGMLPLIDGKEIPGVGDTVNKVLGWIFWGVSVAALFGLIILASTGYENYRNNQGEQFMEKAKYWFLGAVIGSNAPQIVAIFFPSIKLTITAVAIPGISPTVNLVIGYSIWVVGILAVICLLCLAGGAVMAYRNHGMEKFIDDFKWFVLGSLVASFASTIAGAFFPIASTLG
ncbi:hypothetical protein ACPPVW_18585 [Leifsonia sp. McL0607]|uniref:hypothetical protein n=1 Tax=Leifsonia sp. McL0607 TaxID=3415672 RepID=UPI003CE8C9AA